jgi:hypothetical protein
LWSTAAAAMPARRLQALGVRPVADDGGHARVEPPRPVLLLRRAHDGGHVAAAAGDQDHDVFHSGAIILAP